MIFCLSYRNGGTALLLTDGSVMMQECEVTLQTAQTPTRRWWKLVPDRNGSYIHGSWTQLADSHVARLAFASAVLADGRVIVCGGEYSDVSGSLALDRTNRCEIYDPVSNSWTEVAPPNKANTTTPWTLIGDAPCVVLPDGAFMLGSIDTRETAKLDPVTLTWTSLAPRPAASGGTSTEESWVLMPDDTVVLASALASPTTWSYNIATDRWQQGNDIPVGIIGPGHEIGGAVLRYDGTAFFLGGNEHTAVFSPSAGWTNGPDLPEMFGQKLGVLDGPCALLVNGNVLFGAGAEVLDEQESPPVTFSKPSWYFEFDGTSVFSTNTPPTSNCFTFDTRLLLLPTGEVMFTRDDDSSFYAYQSPATPDVKVLPVIKACPSTLTPGDTIEISGLLFNGWSQAVGYGDDAAAATNYPLVRVVSSRGKVRYCRTFDHTITLSGGQTRTSMGVATGDLVISTKVEIPPDIEPGDSELFVVANGVPSLPFPVSI